MLLRTSAVKNMELQKGPLAYMHGSSLAQLLWLLMKCLVKTGILMIGKILMERTEAVDPEGDTGPEEGCRAELRGDCS